MTPWGTPIQSPPLLESKPKRSPAQTALEYTNLGFQFVAAIALGYWGGGWAAQRWDWPWAENTGVCLGVGLGFWMIVRAMKNWEKRDLDGKTPRP